MGWPGIRSVNLRENLVQDAGIAAGGHDLWLTVVVVNELSPIESEEVQQRRLIVVGRYNVLDRPMAEFVGGAVNHTRLHATSGEPHAETLAVVVAAVLLRSALVLRDRQTADLPAPMDQGRIQQSALLQVGHQGGRGLVGSAADRGKRLPDTAVVVPRLPLVKNLHETHTAFDKSPRDQTPRAVLPGVVVIESVQFLSRGRLARNIKCFAGGDLHPGGHFESRDPGLEVGLAREAAAVHLVERLQELEILPLGLASQMRADQG